MLDDFGLLAAAEHAHGALPVVGVRLGAAVGRLHRLARLGPLGHDTGDVQVLQGVQHLLGGFVAVLGIVGAGLEHDGLEGLAAVGRGRQRLAVHAADAGVLVHPGRQLLGRQGQEGHAPLVQQPVQHQAQGVLVRRGAVGLALIDLRRHIFIGADLGAAGRLLHRFGDAEIAQLEVAVVGHEDVLGLDVPVDDVVLFAGHQRLAHVDGEFHHRLLRWVHRQGLGHRRQQLHLDVDVPAEAVLMLDILHVVAVHHVGVALQLAHQGILGHDALQMGAKGAGDALVVVAVVAHLVDVAAVLRNGDDLQRGLLRLAEDVALDLIHPAEAAPADETHRLPAWPGRLLIEFAHMFISSPLSGNGHAAPHVSRRARRVAFT